MGKLSFSYHRCVLPQLRSLLNPATSCLKLGLGLVDGEFSLQHAYRVSTGIVKTPQNYIISLFGVAEVCKTCVPLILPRFVHEAWIIADKH